MQESVLTVRAKAFHPGLVASGATLLIATFISDLLYWKTLLFQWNNVSQWLLAGGMVLVLLSALAVLVDLVLGRLRPVRWLRLAALALAALLGLLDTFVHSRDGYTAIVPEGLALSAIVAAILILVGLTGGWSVGGSVIADRNRNLLDTP